MIIFPIFIPFEGCPGRCIYCQQNYITKTDTSQQKQPDFTRIRREITAFCQNNQNEDKEVAFYGGSFTLLPNTLQESYLDELQGFLPSLSGIRISTRPDGICAAILHFCREKGVATIELGVQSFSDEVLTQTKRFYSRETAINACLLIKEHGFKLGIQLMPGLPGSNRQSLEQTINDTISLKPDFVRIYPTVVIKDTELAQMYSKGEYKTLTLASAVDICASMMELFEQENIKVIKIGLHSDISATADAVVAGPYHPSFGELVAAEVYYRSFLKAYRSFISVNEQADYTISVSPKAISLIFGHNRLIYKRIQNLISCEKLPLTTDSTLSLREIRFTVKQHGSP